MVISAEVRVVLLEEIEGNIQNVDSERQPNDPMISITKHYIVLFANESSIGQKIVLKINKVGTVK